MRARQPPCLVLTPLWRRTLPRETKIKNKIEKPQGGRALGGACCACVRLCLRSRFMHACTHARTHASAGKHAPATHKHCRESQGLGAQEIQHAQRQYQRWMYTQTFQEAPSLHRHSHCPPRALGCAHLLPLPLHLTPAPATRVSGEQLSRVCALSQYLYFCTSKASKLSTCSTGRSRQFSARLGIF